MEKKIDWREGDREGEEEREEKRRDKEEKLVYIHNFITLLRF